MKTDDYSKLVGIMSGIVSVVVGINTLSTNKVLSTISICIAAILFIGLFIFIRASKKPYQVRLASQKIDIFLDDDKGQLATLVHNSRFRALANHVLTFTEHMSVDGAMKDAAIVPGSIKDIRKEGGDLFITWEFGRPLKKGEEIDQKFSAVLTGSFSDATEYWSVRATVPMDSLSVRIHFPVTRVYKSYKGIQRITSHEHLCPIQPREEVVSGRPTLTWEVIRPTFGDVYKIVWDW